MAGGPSIRRGGAADLDRLEPLWINVHRHHTTVQPALAPYVSDATSWAERRSLYSGLLTKPDTVLLLAEDASAPADALVGYGLAHVMPVRQTWVADTWATGPRIGEIESLGVQPSYRGAGLGTALLTALIEALRADGVDDLILGALVGNPATSLYERHGFTPTWQYLSRFAGR
jgi:ribosomal protein S18 acetylase RimI-like enzyme